MQGFVHGAGASVPFVPQRRRPAGTSANSRPGASTPLTGKERYERETAKTYQAAEIMLTRLQARVDEDRHPKSDLTVRQAIEQWLEVASSRTPPGIGTTT
jgi:hypothetical protein